MRILAISDVYFPRINGVSTSIATFHREYEAAGHQVTLIAPTYGGERARYVDEEGVIRIPSRRVPFDPEDRIMKARPVLELEADLAAKDFDALHIQTPFVAHRLGVKLARRLGLPSVETYHTYFEQYLFHYIPFLPKAWLRALARRFSRSQCDQVDRVVVPSGPMERALRDYGVTKPIARIPTGLQLEDFRNGDGVAFRQRHGIAADRPVLVHVGRIAHEKNIGFLLEVLARVTQAVPETLLIIAGEGPALPHLRQMAKRLGLESSVLFVGYLDRRTTLLDCYLAGDAFIFASNTETQGLVLLEAMALGVPVVSTAVMGTKDVLVPGRGALVAEEDVEDFSGKVLLLIRKRHLRRDLGEAARLYAATWSAEAMAERMLELYAEMAGSASSPKPSMVGSGSSTMPQSS